MRDALLGRDIADWDILVAGDAPEVARALANELAGSFVPLDEERSFARVVGPDRVTVDVCGLGGNTLEEDLRRRDFTVNAIAFDGRVVIDPLGGGADLEQRRLRLCSPTSLQDDPLRVMRAFRFMRELQLKLAPGLDEQLQASCSALERVAPERIRDELFRIFRAGLTPVAELMVRTGLLQELFPAYSAAGLAALAELEALTPEEWLRVHLQAPLAGERSRLEVLKLAALHWHCRAETHEAQRLKAVHCLSRHEVDYLSRVLRPEPEGPTSPEERYQLYRRLGDCVPDYAVLLACARPDLKSECDLWLREFHDRSPLAFPPRYLSGADLHELGIPSGREMGRLLGALEHAAALGRVSSRDDARRLAGELWEGGPDPGR